MSETFSEVIKTRVTPTLYQRAAARAARERRTISNLVRVAVERYINCPYCDGETAAHPDNGMSEGGIRYCANCDEPVLRGDGQAAK